MFSQGLKLKFILARTHGHESHLYAGSVSHCSSYFNPLITARTCRHTICSFSFSDVFSLDKPDHISAVTNTTKVIINKTVKNKLPHILIPGANGAFRPYLISVFF